MYRTDWIIVGILIVLGVLYLCAITFGIPGVIQPR